MATFTRFRPDIGDWQRRVSSPSNTVSTNGYKSTSGENKIIAPFSTCKLILLFNTIGPVNHTPAGTTSFPPPFLSKASIALAKDSVQRCMPSPTAPKSFRFISLSGKDGAFTRGISNGKSL